MLSDKNSQQLTLPITTSELPSFDNFVVGSNEEVVTHLKTLSLEQHQSLFYLYGKKGCGVSHLLQSMVNLCDQKKQLALYISLSELELEPDLLNGLESSSLLCLDHLESIIARADWQEALFHLFNRVKDSGHSLIFGGQNLPRNLPIQLPDLVSRLNSMVRFHIHDISDQDKERVLIQRATAYGLNCPKEVAVYLISRVSRDLNQLMKNLDRLEQASLATKRPLTIPFVKEILGL